MVALIVILFPPLLIAFLLVMERVEEPLRRPTSQREVEALAQSGIRRAMTRWRRRRRRPAVASGRRAVTDRGSRTLERASDLD